MTDPILHLPLESNEHGEITDARGHNVLDAWFLASEDDDGLPEEEREARAAARAAEVVRRVNLHDELVVLALTQDSAFAGDSIEDIAREYGNSTALRIAAVRAVLAKLEAR